MLPPLPPLTPLPPLREPHPKQALKMTPADHQSAAGKGLIFVFSDFCAICAISLCEIDV